MTQMLFSNYTDVGGTAELQKARHRKQMLLNAFHFRAFYRCLFWQATDFSPGKTSFFFLTSAEAADPLTSHLINLHKQNRAPGDHAFKSCLRNLQLHTAKQSSVRGPLRRVARTQAAHCMASGSRPPHNDGMIGIAGDE